MEACAACGTRVDDGLTKCPQCGANLARPGAFVQVMGWVACMISLIPLVVGFVTMKQQSFAPLGLGIVILSVGVVAIIAGRIKTAQSPPTTVPVNVQGIPSPEGMREAQPKGEARTEPSK
jgi:hypothetical protein